MVGCFDKTRGVLFTLVGCLGEWMSEWMSEYLDSEYLDSESEYLESQCTTKPPNEVY